MVFHGGWKARLYRITGVCGCLMPRTRPYGMRKQTARMGEYLIYNGQPLASMTRYFWQVQTDIDGSIQKSPLSSFFDRHLA